MLLATILLCHLSLVFYLFFFFNDTATTEIYTLSLHDALPILHPHKHESGGAAYYYSDQRKPSRRLADVCLGAVESSRSEEHTSELQSQSNLVCRLLLEKKKKNTIKNDY